ncbi:hypothetical protein SISSUDRAFT_293694 [Sistotremastrum suecicum HHB10207 ss-3]|uniref:Uncharacterized protein n=1 Tax=Sistotremastrum suecicum HHB10207 ss-3 TaxID=1314776 RepID=A0A165ZHY4_9AGAM|nr:hypothetical protein SISSUDRAFT_293694 [Sistotremastrum suecicum HHB10207 ss-3]
MSLRRVIHVPESLSLLPYFTITSPSNSRSSWRVTCRCLYSSSSILRFPACAIFPSSLRLDVSPWSPELYLFCSSGPVSGDQGTISGVPGSEIFRAHGGLCRVSHFHGLASFLSMTDRVEHLYFALGPSICGYALTVLLDFDLALIPLLRVIFSSHGPMRQ